MDTHSKKFQCNEIAHAIRSKALECGFVRCGFAEARPVEEYAAEQYDSWIAAQKHDEMHYLTKYGEVRRDPRLLLEGARSIIAVALNYYPKTFQPADAAQFAYYAYGKDYHDVVRERLAPVARLIKENWGAESRICVDTAPLRERYWAVECGIGFIGVNNMLIVPDVGSYVFLGFIITTLEITPDKPCRMSCINCRRCIACCPTHSISDLSAIDARSCLSCLTIEHRGDLPSGIDQGKRVYGCDTCQKVCPHNRFAPSTEIEEFSPEEGLLSLTKEKIMSMSEEEYRSLFRDSAVRRAKLAQLVRNAKNMT